MKYFFIGLDTFLLDRLQIIEHIPYTQNVLRLIFSISHVIFDKQIIHEIKFF